MKLIIPLFCLFIAATTHAADCYHGVVNGGDIGGLTAGVTYDLYFSIPGPGETGRLGVRTRGAEIAGGQVYGETESTFSFRNYDGLFSFTHDDGRNTIAVDGGQLDVNEAGDLHVQRRSGRSREYALTRATTAACRRFQ